MPLTDEQIFEKEVMAHYTPDQSVARRDWVPFPTLLHKLQAIRPELSNRTKNSDAYYALQLVKAWCAEHEAFKGLAEDAYCQRLQDFSPGAKPSSKVWKFAFRYTPASGPA